MCDLKLFCTFYSKVLQVKPKYTIKNVEKVKFYQNIAFLAHDMKCNKIIFEISFVF